MDNFTPISGLLGDALIGVSSVWLMLTLGRIAGISGIADGALIASGDRAWRWAFVTGLVLGALALSMAYADWRPPVIEAGLPLVIFGGLLVGVGTKFGSGCTSGHGVCGLARLSMRSLVATCTFLATAIATVYIVRHLMTG